MVLKCCLLRRGIVLPKNPIFCCIFVLRLGLFVPYLFMPDLFFYYHFHFFISITFFSFSLRLKI